MCSPIINKNSMLAVVSFFVAIIMIIATTVSLYSSPAYGHANPVSYSPSALDPPDPQGVISLNISDR
jgi:hypothetical protein